MKSNLFVLLMLFFPLIGKSGSDISYVFQMEVVYDKEKATGFVWIGAIYQDINQGFSSDTFFASIVKKWNQGDTLRLYQEVYFIDSLNLQIYFKNKLIKIDENKITSVRLIKMIETGFGSWVSEDRFEAKDQAWLKNSYIMKENYWEEACNFIIYFFEKPDQKLLDRREKLMRNYSTHLSAEEYKKWAEQLYDYLEFLEKYKVVVQHICNC